MTKRATKSRSIPAVTIVIEWENAIDVEDKWTRAAMAALERELEAVASGAQSKPRVLYLYDRNAVDPSQIEDMVSKTASRLRDFADLEIVPTDGLTYYKLKNYGIGRSKTDLSIMLDSDAPSQRVGSKTS